MRRRQGRQAATEEEAAARVVVQEALPDAVADPEESDEMAGCAGIAGIVMNEGVLGKISGGICLHFEQGGGTVDEKVASGTGICPYSFI